MLMQRVNKYQGLLLLKQYDLPTITWDIFTYDTTLPSICRWTLRAVKEAGNDFGLPIFFNLSSDDAIHIGRNMLNQYLKNNYIFLIYPYFSSEKTGTILIDLDRSIIEAVREDCCNLTRHSKLDISIVYKNTREVVFGDIGFFDKTEISLIENYVSRLRRQFFRDLLGGSIVVLEWSFASYSGGKKNDFIFQELRIIDTYKR